MKSYAESRGLELACLLSVTEMGSISCFSDYDVAIVENDKGILSGNEIGEYLTKLLNEMPLILISCGLQPTQKTRNSWPKAIRGFVHKHDGPDAILNSALQSHSKMRLKL